MTDECCSAAGAGPETCELRVMAVGRACPTNGKVGKFVDSLTLKAMLAKPLTELRTVEYRFCKDSDCPTVYYSVDGLQTFTEADLRERVYQKHTDEEDIFVCYCFRQTIGDILSDVNVSGGKAVVEKINQGIRNGQCACDIRNPQGSCCLGNVNAVIKRAQRNWA